MQNSRHSTFNLSITIQTTLFCLVIFCLVFFCSAAISQDVSNIQLNQRTAYPLSMNVIVPVLFENSDEFILYGDSEILEKFIPNNEGGFTSVSYFQCQPESQCL